MGSEMCIRDRLRTGRRRSGQHDNHRLSDEARHAKQLRGCEQRYRRTDLESDRQVYLSARSAARDRIIKSELSGDISATWQTAQRVLHNDDTECASTFCQFFVDKVNRIRNNISEALRTSHSLVCLLLDHTADRRCQLSSQ